MLEMTSAEKTFTGFTPDQAAAYAEIRGSAYPRPLYDEIFMFHGSRPRTAFMDVGTGPGNVVFDLLSSFERGFGCDSSISMIEQAKSNASRLNVGYKTSFAVSGGESCAEAFSDVHVDLVTVAMAAHWLDMESFYASAAKVLKPDGTLAIWTCSSLYVHPSIENHEDIQKALTELEDGMLAPHSTPGNLLSRNAYEGLLLPWDNSSTAALFDSKSFARIDWDRHGIPSALPFPDGSSGRFLHDQEQTVEEFVNSLGSSSMVIRWRESNPDMAYTSEDPVYITGEKLKKASKNGLKKLTLSPSTTLLLMRRA